MLDLELKSQLNQYLKLLENDIVIELSVDSDDKSQELVNFVNEIASLSSKIHLTKKVLERTPSFKIKKTNEDTGVCFAGIPTGHEFTSLVLALLQVSGRPPKVDDKLIEQIKQIDMNYQFTTYVSLTCQICPDVVQALNLMAILNPKISHTMVDGALFKKEIEAKDILAVPTIYMNDEHFHSGRISLEEILQRLGAIDNTNLKTKEPFDVLIIGGGPAGSSAAIYASRKGIRTGVIAERIGGQILDTLSIENMISVKHTEGPKLAQDLESHMQQYDIDIMKARRVVNIKKDQLFEVELDNGTMLKSKTIIVATGARWRNVNVPGEKEFLNKGVAYCPHCDGPLFKGKDVAVIGGGNSGIEAAIDLAGITSHVYVIEFLPELKADKVLQERLYSLPNVTVIKNAQTKEITGTTKVDGLTYIDRDSGNEHHIVLQGVFVQIGLVPNTSWLNDFLEKNRFGEILIDSRGQTNVPGVFAAGDCANTPYKQIIVSMGSGAIAALSAFDYLIKN